MHLRNFFRLQRLTIWALLVIALASTATAVLADCGKSEPVYHFEIPASDLASAFIAAHQQAHIDLTYEAAEQFQSVRVRPVSGSFTLCQALTRMFTGTGL